MAKRHLARASSGSRFPLAYAPKRLEETIQVLTDESIEDSLEAIKVAFRKHFGEQPRGRGQARKKVEAD